MNKINYKRYKLLGIFISFLGFLIVSLSFISQPIVYANTGTLGATRYLPLKDTVLTCYNYSNSLYDDNMPLPTLTGSNFADITYKPRDSYSVVRSLNNQYSGFYCITKDYYYNTTLHDDIGLEYPIFTIQFNGVYMSYEYFMSLYNSQLFLYVYLDGYNDPYTVMDYVFDTNFYYKVFDSNNSVLDTELDNYFVRRSFGNGDFSTLFGEFMLNSEDTLFLNGSINIYLPTNDIAQNLTYELRYYCYNLLMPNSYYFDFNSFVIESDTPVETIGSSVTALFNVEIFPGFYVWSLFVVVVGASVLAFGLKVFLGG